MRRDFHDERTRDTGTGDAAGNPADPRRRLQPSRLSRRVPGRSSGRRPQRQRPDGPGRNNGKDGGNRLGQGRWRATPPPARLARWPGPQSVGAGRWGRRREQRTTQQRTRPAARADPRGARPGPRRRRTRARPQGGPVHTRRSHRRGPRCARTVTIPAKTRRSATAEERRGEGRGSEATSPWRTWAWRQGRRSATAGPQRRSIAADASRSEGRAAQAVGAVEAVEPERARRGSSDELIAQRGGPVNARASRSAGTSCVVHRCARATPRSPSSRGAT